MLMNARHDGVGTNFVVTIKQLYMQFIKISVQKYWCENIKKQNDVNAHHQGVRTNLFSKTLDSCIIHFAKIPNIKILVLKHKKYFNVNECSYRWSQS